MKCLPMLGSAYSGSMRGITASHNAGGLYFRGRTIPTNPDTPLQGIVRAALSSLTSRWSSVLSEAQRLAWNEYAANVAWIDSLGQSIKLSGIAMYTRTGVVISQLNALAAAGLDLPDIAPTVNLLGITPQIGVVTLANAVGPPNVLTASVNFTNDGDYSAGDLLIVYISGGINPGVEYYKGPYTLSLGDGDATTSPASITLFDDTPSPQLWSNRWGTPPVGQQLRGYARVLHNDNRLSSQAIIDFGLIPAAA